MGALSRTAHLRARPSSVLGGRPGGRCGHLINPTGPASFGEHDRHSVSSLTDSALPVHQAPNRMPASGVAPRATPCEGTQRSAPLRVINPIAFLGLQFDDATTCLQQSRLRARAGWMNPAQSVSAPLAPARRTAADEPATGLPGLVAPAARRAATSRLAAATEGSL